MKERVRSGKRDWTFFSLDWSRRSRQSDCIDVARSFRTAPPAFRPEETPLLEHEARDLKRRTLRGALASGMAQGAAFVIRTVSMVAMSRLLFPRDFGLFGMVVAFTGVLSLFRDFGLSLASVTRASVSNDQLSTLFWVNIGVGTLLATACVLAAPLLVGFYAEPRLLSLTMAVGAGFVFMGAGAQHRAILQRGMRFGTLGVIDTVALVIGVAAGIGTAASGGGSWALVVLTVCPQIVGTAGMWLATRWIPGRPVRHSGVRSMLWFGGTVTLNGLVVYVAYNLDKVLLGRYWGADALGVYGRAYQPSTSRTRASPQRCRRWRSPRCRGCRMNRHAYAATSFRPTACSQRWRCP